MGKKKTFNHITILSYSVQDPVLFLSISSSDMGFDSLSYIFRTMNIEPGYPVQRERKIFFFRPEPELESKSNEIKKSELLRELTHRI